MAQPQSAIQAGPGRSARFLVLELGPDAEEQVRAGLAGVPNLVRAVGHRDEAMALSCVVAIGADAWSRLQPGRSRPAQLHPFQALADGGRLAPSTPGDVLLHIRAEREDFCYELARLILARLGDAVTVIDETHGFAYLDSRDLIGFVDGTENPSGDERLAFTIVGDEEPDHAAAATSPCSATSPTSTPGRRSRAKRRRRWSAEPGRTTSSSRTNAVCRRRTRSGRRSSATAPSRRSCATTAPTARHARPARTSSPMPATFRSPRGCSSGCSSPTPTATTTACSTSRAPVTGTHFFAPSQDALEALADPAPQAITESAAQAVAEPAGTDSSLQIGSLRLR